MGTGDILRGRGGGVTLQWISIPSRGGVAILLGLFLATETGRVGLWLSAPFLTLLTVGHVN